jgi:Eco29kI restriction endonuclease
MQRRFRRPPRLGPAAKSAARSAFGDRLKAAVFRTRMGTPLQLLGMSNISRVALCAHETASASGTQFRYRVPATMAFPKVRQMPSYDTFDLDIPLAVREQLDAKFQTLTTDPLDGQILGSLPPGQGVYELFHQGILVYAGKAKDLPSRLLNHCRKIGGRQNIVATDVGFKCLYLGPNWITFAAEDALIQMYTPQGLCAWNGAGFGPKDPGKRRDDTVLKADHWDLQYPIRYDFPLAGIQPGAYECLPLLRLMKTQLPFNLRYHKANPTSVTSGHPDYNGVTINVPVAGMPAHEMLIGIAQSLPSGWQAIRFPHQLTIYKETRPYPSGVRLFP